MSRAVVIRPATHDDVEALAMVCERSARRAYAGLATDDYVDRVVQHFFQPERLSREVLPAGDWFGFVVAQVGSVVAGVSGTGRSAHRLDACELYALYVDPAFQRQGIGSALVAHSIEQAAASGAALLDVSVMPGNESAIRFYESCGFVSAGEREIYAPHGRAGGPEVALVYTATLAGRPFAR
jgi:ribosomal protein S18 acetylase RimI-like enzyme